MVGESWENWRRCVARTIEMAPESVTIYQMELPYNTVYSKDILGNQIEMPVADWPTKREWVSYAFDQLQAAGYHVSSAYTMIKNPQQVSFSYRDHLWQGADLLATGIASFGHLSGVHYQNLADWDGYVAALLERGELPLGRALAADTAANCSCRELILAAQERVARSSLLPKEIQRRRRGAMARRVWQDYAAQNLLRFDAERIELTRDGLLRVDGLLPAFFEQTHRGVRYT